jgi:hypothetical protein
MMKVLRLSGSAAEIGTAIGEECRDDIATVAARWTEDLADGLPMTVPEFIDTMLDNTGYLKASQTWTPECLIETKAIAEAANLAWRTLLAMQYADETWIAKRRLLHVAKAGGLGTERCSSFGVRDMAGAPTMIGQTMDLPGWSNGLQTLVSITDPDGHQVVYLSIAGALPTCGVNNAALGVCCNTLLSLRGDEQGLPVVHMLRLALRQRRFGDMLTVLHTVPHASGQNYLIGGPGQIASLECSAEVIAGHRVAGRPSRLVHTNHSLANADHDPEFAGSPVALGTPSTRARLASIATHVLMPSDLTLGRLQAALAAQDDPNHPVSRELALAGTAGDFASFTFAGIIYELDADTPRLHVTDGPPSQSPFTTFALAGRTPS